MDKTSVDVGETDQIVSFTVEAKDESGVDWWNPSTMLEFNDPTGKSYYINFSAEAPHVASYTFSSESKLGVWVVGEVRLFDTLKPILLSLRCYAGLVYFILFQHS